ncbi:kiwellin-1-like [Andrographis paniculata]|uniref:kiwellin-1-like n=1 Tax=Andrographis paniculata TaxID=175694 RepID=UPI0021E98161|nr:kiwellin-1-like [Andrographis paniculata]
MKNVFISSFIFLSFYILIALSSVDAAGCKSSGKIKGKKPPKDKCNTSNDSECCEEGKYYDIYKCSPKESGRTKAVLTLNGFEKGKDGGGPAECDGHYHSDNIPIVAMSTGWFNKMKRCFQNVTIYGRGKKVTAMVIDECDSTMGCDEEHDYQPPCPNNIVDGSRAVWEALGVPKKDWGLMEVQWEDA